MPQVITFHYTLTDKRGQMLDTSRNGAPFTFLQGSGQIIPGLETALIVLTVGDRKTVNVPYQQAYGAYDQRLIYQVTRNRLPSENVKVGDMFEISTEGGSFRIVTVVEIKESDVVLDGNHPLAGQDLTFEVEIMNMRAATAEEISHGHIHGEHGHDHHHPPEGPPDEDL